MESSGWEVATPGGGGATTSTGGEPASTPVESVTPAPAATPKPAQAPAASAPSGSGSRFGLPDVRGLWPTMINEIKGMRRLTWMLLTNNAQVVGVDDTTLTLGFDSAGARDSFTRGDHADLVSKAGVKVVGHAWRVEAIISQGGPTAPASFAPVAAVPEPPTDDDPQPDEGRVPTAYDMAAADRVATNPAREALRQAASEPGQAPSRPDPQAADAEAHYDDPDAESAGMSAAELLQRELGATIIDEIRHDR